MKPTDKQTALKAGLLMILAANISWHTSQSFQSSDLASSATDAGVSRGVVPGRTSGGDVQIAPPPPPAPPSDAAGPKPDAPISSTTVSVKESTEQKQICSVDFKIHFIQQTEAGKVVVHAYVSRVSPREDFQGLVKEGTYQNLIADQESKAQLLELIRTMAAARLKNEGFDCSSQASAPASSGDTDPDADADARRIARGVRNCTLAQDGSALPNSKRYSCNLARLEKISLAKDVDRDGDETLPSDNRGRNRSNEQSDSLAKVHSALDPLERSIKFLMLSDDQDKRADGEERLDDVVSALEDVRDTATVQADRQAMNTLIANLKKSYPVGEKLNQDTGYYAAKIDALNNQISNLTNAISTSTDMNQRAALSQQLQYVQTYVRPQYTQQLAQQMANNTDYLQLRNYEQTNVISPTDYSDFASSYNQLLQSLQPQTGVNGVSQNGQPAAPNGAVDARTQAIANDPRAAGIPSALAYPQINYQALGLQNPSIAGATNPAFQQPIPGQTYIPQQQQMIYPQQQMMYPRQQVIYPQQQAYYPQVAYGAPTSVFTQQGIPGRMY